MREAAVRVREALVSDAATRVMSRHYSRVAPHHSGAYWLAIRAWVAGGGKGRLRESVARGTSLRHERLVFCDPGDLEGGVG